jgi:hypothetical protein
MGETVYHRSSSSGAPAPSSNGARTGAVAAFFEQFEKEQKERKKAQSLRAAQRREERAQTLPNRTFLSSQEADISP